MKVSRNTTTNVAHSSSHKSSPKPSKSSSSSSSVSHAPLKSSATSPSKSVQSGNAKPKNVKPSHAPSKVTKTNTVQSKPVKQSTGHMPQNTVKTVTKPVTGYYTAKTGINSQVSKKDNKASETVVLKKTVSKKDSATSKAIEVKDVASKKDSSSSKVLETKKATPGHVDNRSHVNAVSVTRFANVVKTEHIISDVSSSNRNGKKDNNTDKRKKTDNKQLAGSIRRGYYNSVRIMQNKGTTVRAFADKSGIAQILNGSAITIPKEFIQKGKKRDGILQTIGYLLNDAGKAGRKLLSDMVKMAY